MQGWIRVPASKPGPAPQPGDQKACSEGFYNRFWFTLFGFKCASMAPLSLMFLLQVVKS